MLIYKLLLTLYWNFTLRWQIPVGYTSAPTDNHFFTRRENITEAGVITTIFVVHQYRHLRSPSGIFPSYASYSYKVEAVIYNGDTFHDSQVWILPELCSALYRGTNIPHLCAVNSIMSQLA